MQRSSRQRLITSQDIGKGLLETLRLHGPEWWKLICARWDYTQPGDVPGRLADCLSSKLRQPREERGADDD